MQIKTLQLGELQTNCYILEKNNEIIIIDPADNFNEIKKAINNKKVVACLVTHFHLDHIGALEECLSYYNLNINKLESTNFKMEIIATPGHTNDSQTFYFVDEKIMFVGDFIFKNGIGRTDLGGNTKDMIESLKNICSYPDDTKIYPGHGPTTTLGEEKIHFSNYFWNGFFSV